MARECALVSPAIRVLLVDDAPEIRSIGRVSLETIGGLETRVAASGAEGIAVARTWTPDVILLDVLMPGMDGPETLAELRRTPGLEAVPVIFLTGRAGVDDVRRYVERGALGAIPKPFDPQTLADEVVRLLEGRP